MRCFAILGVLLLTLLRSEAQQQPHFSQYMFSGLVINPAYAGADEVLSATFINRHQWLGIEGAPTTQTLALHALTKRKKVGLGLLISHDRIGVHKNTTAQLSYAYHVRLSSNHTLSFGLQAGLVQLIADYASLANTTPDPKLARSHLKNKK
ncbi:MAG: PorP/SprF family type IX secretion system membrane protein [Flammeovirgaceae bacterium]